MNFTASIHTGNEGLFWLTEIKKLHKDISVIMITAYGDIDLAVRSLKEGAADFVIKPWHNEKLISTISEALKKKENKPGTAVSSPQTREMIGESEEMDKIFLKLEKLRLRMPISLILGENGTEKDLIANAIHQLSHRASKPFVKVDVGALTENLFESELFWSPQRRLYRCKRGRNRKVWSSKWRNIIPRWNRKHTASPARQNF